MGGGEGPSQHRERPPRTPAGGNLTRPALGGLSKWGRGLNGFQDTGGKESGWRALCGGPAWGTTPLSSPFVTKPPNTGLRPATQKEGGEDRASAGAAEAAGSGGPTAEW